MPSLSALLLPLLATLGTQDLAGDGAEQPDRARVWLEAGDGPVWVDGPLELSVLFELEEELVRDGLLQLFPRPLELPVQVQGPWLEDLPGLERLPDPTPPGAGQQGGGEAGPELALGEGLARARRLGSVRRGERTWLRFALELRRRPTFPGPLELGAPELRYAHATRFEEQGLFGPRPLDRREVRVQGDPVTLEVRPLPEEGRPEAFRGAVGRLEPRLRAQPLELVVGETLELVLEPGGEGVPADFEPPRPERQDGSRLLAVRQEGEGPGARIVYELEVLGEDLRLTPGLELAWFDPSPPAGYRSWRSERLELRVRPRPAAPAPPSAGSGPGTPAVLAVAGILGAGLWLLVRRRRAPLPPFRAPFALGLERGEDPTEVWLAYLAARLGTTPAGVVGQDLEERLVGAGVGQGAAAEAARLAEALVGARYGGEAPTHPRERVARALEALDGSWPT